MGFSPFLIMKSVSDSVKKTDSDPVNEPVKEGEGIDALKVGQILVIVLCAIFIAGFLLHNILHII